MDASSTGSASSSAVASVDLPLPDYDLAATLDGGQAFRWRAVGAGWEGVVQGRWVRLEPGPSPGRLRAWTAPAEDVGDWAWLRAYLALDEDLEAILRTFPADAPLAAATAAARGLRLLRQDPWECLASFILSSTKQVVQIQECVRLLSERFGRPIPAGLDGLGRAWAFPDVDILAGAEESALRACKMGFRAKYLRGTATLLSNGSVSLERIAQLPTASAREELERCPGVGRKVADCVLLFAYGRQDAFPVDVWVQQALHRLYFPRARRVGAARLRRFSETYFGANAGYAQQYLFHYVRNVLGRRWWESGRS